MSTNQQMIDQLKARLATLSAQDQTWAGKLIKFWEDKKRLSPTQAWHVDQLIQKPVSSQPAGPVNLQDEGETQVGRLDTLQRLFDNAKKHIKAPAVIFHVTGVGHVMMGVPYRKDDKGIEVCIKKGSYGYKYIGTVEDEYFYPKNKWQETPARIFELLKALSSDPVHTLVEYGKNSGICAFCGAGLEDPESVKRGIGPVCRKNYNCEDLEAYFKRYM